MNVGSTSRNTVPEGFPSIALSFSSKGIADEWSRAFFCAKPRTSIDRDGIDTARRWLFGLEKQLDVLAIGKPSFATGLCVGSANG